MKDVIILGTGGLAAEITFYIEENNSKVGKEEQIRIKGYIDYDYNIEKYYDHYKFKAPVLCDIDAYVPSENEEVLIGIGNVEFRNKMIEQLKTKKAQFGSFIHHTVIISGTQKLGKGNLIFPYCVIEPHCTIGDFNILTAYSFISHDCTVGNGNFFSKAGIAGHSSVGDNNYFGINATVIPRVKIGNNNLIQAGMIVHKNVKDDTTVFYRFKEQIMAIPKPTR
ncbi:MAG: acetyltransferase [Flavobacteriaceae bacterium]|nr:acetyltransferase [Flavobacteriaceae bacterium]